MVKTERLPHVLLAFLAAGWSTGCAHYSVGDLEDNPEQDKVREKLGSRVVVYFHTQLQYLDSPLLELKAFTIYRTHGASLQSRLESIASEHLAEAGVFDPPPSPADPDRGYERTGGRVTFGMPASEYFEHDLRVQLTLVERAHHETEKNKAIAALLTLMIVPIWSTTHRELRAEVRDSNDERVLSERYKERHRIVA